MRINLDELRESIDQILDKPNPANARAVISTRATPHNTIYDVCVQGQGVVATYSALRCGHERAYLMANMVADAWNRRGV